MDILKQEFIKGFIRLTQDAYQKGWHECNGGNLTYRMRGEEVAAVKDALEETRPFCKIGVSVPNLAGEYFLVTGSGKFFRNVECDPENTIGIIEVDKSGENYRIVWGLSGDGRPTSELPTHLLNMSVKKNDPRKDYRVILHSHPTNLIALSFVLPLDTAVFTRELWEMATECPIIFPDGLGIVDWMVPGGMEIATATAKLMQEQEAVLWAHHGLFCAGETFDKTFGLMDTIEKAAEILVKVRSMGGKQQTITVRDFRELAEAFHVTLPEKYLSEDRR